MVIKDILINLKFEVNGEIILGHNLIIKHELNRNFLTRDLIKIEMDIMTKELIKSLGEKGYEF